MRLLLDSKKIIILGVIVFMISGMCISPVRANDASLGRAGEGVRPIASTEVKMVSQLVRMKVSKQYSTVEIDFVFQNTGDKAGILMGFPEGSLPKGGPYGDRGDVRLQDFAAFVNGEEVSITKEKEIFIDNGIHDFNYPFWYTWLVKFDKNEIKSIRTSYKVKNTINSSGYIETGYLLQTGSPWKGTIGEGKIIFQMDDVLPYHLEGVYPTDYKFEGENLAWYYRDLEPAENIRILFNPHKEWDTLKQFLDEDDVEQLYEYEESKQYDLALDYLGKIDVDQDLEVEELLLMKKSFYLTQLERGAEAKLILEKLMSKNSRHPQVYYYLAKLYSEDDNERKLFDVYRKLRELKINPQLMRWVGTMLPQERVSERAPVISSVQLRRDPGSGNLLFYSSIEDVDGNLSSVRMELWTYENGVKKALANHKPQFYTQPYKIEPEIDIGQLPYYTVVYGQIWAEDGEGNAVDSGVRSFLIQDIREDWISLPIGRIHFNYIGLTNREANRVKNVFRQALKEIRHELKLEPKSVIHVNIIGDGAQVVYDEKGYRDDFLQLNYSLRSKEPNRAVANEIMKRILTQNTGSGWIHASPWLLDDLTQNIVFKKNKLKTSYLMDKGEERFHGFLLKVGETGDVDLSLQSIYGMDMKTLDEKWAVYRMIPWLTTGGLFVFIACILLWWRRKQLMEENKDS